MDLIKIFRLFHPNTEEYTLFLSTHDTFSRIDHILGHKSSLSKFKKIEIISGIFSDHNTMRLDINYGKNPAKPRNSWRLNNTFLNSQQVNKETKRKVKKFLETNDNENMMTQNIWNAATTIWRGKFKATQPYFKKQGKHWIDNLALHLK